MNATAVALLRKMAEIQEEVLVYLRKEEAVDVDGIRLEEIQHKLEEVLHAYWRFEANYNDHTP